MNPLDGLDDDDLIALDRYRPLTNRGIDKLLGRLQAMAHHPTNQTTTTVLVVELPTHVARYLAVLDPNYWAWNDKSPTDQAVAAVARAARNQQ